MNNLAFQIYGTKKATPFQSVWKTDQAGAFGGELANRAASSVPTDWSGTNLSTGGYTHNGSGSNNLPFTSLGVTEGQSYRIGCTLSAGSIGSVIINFGGVSSVQISTTTTITLTATTTGTLSITPVNFVGTVSLSIRVSSSATNQIQLPIDSIAVGKSIWIDWGDNSYTNANNSNYVANRIHTYSTPGEYTVRILGDDFSFGFGNPNTVVNDRLKIKSISSWGKLKMWVNSFNGCSNVTMSGITDIPDLTGLTTLSTVFQGCSLLTTVGRINEWNTSSVTNMSYMFAYCPLFNSNIGNWNTSAVTNMTSMFGSFNSSSNFNQDISGWNVSNVTQMNQMFDYATSFNQNLSNWERPGSSLSKVTNMEYMFRGASNFNNGFAYGVGVGNQLPWTINTDAASVSMTNMFSGASAFNSNLGKGTIPWDVSNVGTFADMFNGASKFNNGDETDVTKSKINNWDIGESVTSVAMTGMFRSAIAFNRDISSWNVTKVNSMSNMFYGASAFNQPIGSWNVSNVFYMNNMFRSTSAFNQPLGNWERSTPGNVSTVSKVITFENMFQSASAFNNGGSTNIGTWAINTTLGANVNMGSMFVTAVAFNQPLNSWNTSEVINMVSMFRSSVFNNGLLSGVADTLAWNTGKVTDMAGMFSYNPAFNQNIGSWNVSKVTNMSNMFNRASNFNQPLGNWERVLSPDTSTLGKVVTMGGMFQEATVFNQSIGNWDVNKVVDFGSMFDTSIYFTGSAFNNGLLPGVSGTLAWNINTAVASVNMSRMFNGAWAFNQNINSWNVSKVTNMLFMFRQASAFNQPLNSWDVSQVTSMSNMFNDANTFDKDISSWNVGKVTDMSYMFASSNSYSTNVFNNGSNSDNNSVTGLQGINGWNINTVAVSVLMNNMFEGNPVFNRNIGSWNVSKVTNFSNFLNGKTPATFSSTNLDAIYNGWIVNGVKPNTSSPLSTNISFGTAKYSQAGKTGKDTLLAIPNNWRILDGLLSVSSISNNGGSIRVATVTTHGFVTGNSVYIYGVLGTTNANGTWTVTKVNDSIIELQGSNYNGTYISNSGNVIVG